MDHGFTQIKNVSMIVLTTHSTQVYLQKAVLLYGLYSWLKDVGCTAFLYFALTHF